MRKPLGVEENGTKWKGNPERVLRINRYEADEVALRRDGGN